MSRPLIITEAVRFEIWQALARADASPIPSETMRQFATLAAGVRELKLADRAPGLERPASEHVEIPIGFRAAISVEEQPAGMVRHLSISVDKVGRMPSEAAVMVIAEEFGMVPPFDGAWLEEFDPGHHAVNLLKLVVPRPEGVA